MATKIINKFSFQKNGDTYEFNPKVLSPVFTNSTSEIDLNCLNDIQYDHNSGDTDTTITLGNIPETSGSNLLVVNNERGANFNLILPSSFGIFTVKNMIQSPVVVPDGGSVELHLLRIYINPTSCEIRITGGVSV